MEKAFELYPILRAYSNKHNSAYIKIDEFLRFLVKYAARMAPQHPEWKPWTQETNVRFWNEMKGYTNDGRCVLLTDTTEGRIFLPYFYVEKLKEIYQDLEKTAGSPFPSEESLGFTFPEDQVEELNLETDLIPYFEKQTGSFLPIIKLRFPDDWGSALLLPLLIPRRILEAAIFKIRYYLMERNNRDYITHKMYPHMQGRETFVRDTMDTIISHPLDCVSSLESSGESTFLFWACFCFQIKSDIGKKNERLSGDIAAVQAAFVIEICNNLFKSHILQERERDNAFRTLEANMDKAPYYYTTDSIIKFTNSTGAALLGQYSNKDLENYIREKTAEKENDEVPAWIMITTRNGEKWFIKKGNLLHLVTRLLSDARPSMLKETSSRWKQLIQSFKSEPAMENDAEFDKLLFSSIGIVSPALKVFLDDPRLFLVYTEIERAQGKITPPASRIFHNGKLIPMNLLFGLRRKEILASVKLSMPFWYSMPIISPILAFFAGFTRKKGVPRQVSPKQVNQKQVSPKQVNPKQVNINSKEAVSPKRSYAQELVNSARAVAANLVPQGRTLDEYIREVESRWSKLLDKQAQKNLVEDINSLVRDNLRKTLKLRKHSKLSGEDLKNLAEGIVKGTPILETLKASHHLCLYMQLYMLKLLLTIRL
ncbi:MAG: hypothetical protein LBR93_04975 [Treponema sp.]|jgi:hypothetical protein|nr:hypothetical protein [Treponema sp.]